MKIKPFTFVAIIWKDAEYDSNPGWKTLEEFTSWAKTRRRYVQTGCFINDKDGFINLCSGFSDDGNGRIYTTCGVNSIPKGCIKKIVKMGNI